MPLTELTNLDGGCQACPPLSACTAGQSHSELAAGRRLLKQGHLGSLARHFGPGSSLLTDACTNLKTLQTAGFCVKVAMGSRLSHNCQASQEEAQAVRTVGQAMSSSLLVSCCG